MNNSIEIQWLYKRLLQAVEIPVAEANIPLSGFYAIQDSKQQIFINKSLDVSDKVNIILHEYAHYLHLNKYYENESRTDCELIAGCTAFFVLKNFQIISENKTYSEMLNSNKNHVSNLLNKSQQIANEIINKIENI